MSEQFDAGRPIYAQLVERLKARILAGTYPPGGHLDSVPMTSRQIFWRRCAASATRRKRRQPCWSTGIQRR